MIAAVVVLATCAAYAYYDAQTRTYRASTKLFLNPSQVEALVTGVVSEPGSDRAAQNLAALAHTQGVAALVARRLRDGRSPDQILAVVRVTPAQGTDFLTISAKDEDPTRAARTANAFAAAFEASRTAGARRQVREAANQARRQLDALGSAPTTTREAVEDRLAQLEGFLASPLADVRRLDPAGVPRTPIAPKPVRNAIFAGTLALLLAVFAIYAFSRFDLRIRRVSDIEDAYALPLLTAIPHLQSKGRDATIVDAAAQEPLRSLQTALRLASLEGPVKTFLITSAVPCEGKSTLVRNLALVQRDEGARVVIVEADLRRPVLRSWFKLQHGEGLTDVIAGQTPLAQALQSIASTETAVPSAVPTGRRHTVETLTRLGELSVLTSGPKPPNPSIVLASDQAADVIKQLAATHTYVLIDAPPLLPVSDALPLLTLVDGVIIVSRIGTTHRTAAKRLMEMLERVPGAKILGIVANDVPEDEHLGTYAYSYGAFNGGRSKS